MKHLSEGDDVSYRLDGRFADFVAEESARTPLAHEEVSVGREKRETGRVRLHKHVETHTEEIEYELLREHVTIDRVPVERELEAPAETRREGDTLIIPIMEERLVVTKQLVLVEELHVSRRQESTAETREVTLRRTEVDVERESAEGGGDAS